MTLTKDKLLKEIKRLCAYVDVLHAEGKYKEASRVLKHASTLKMLMNSLGSVSEVGSWGLEAVEGISQTGTGI